MTCFGKKSLYLVCASLLSVTFSALAQSPAYTAEYLPLQDSHDVMVRADFVGASYSYDNRYYSNNLGTSSSGTKRTSKFVTSPADIKLSIFYEDWRLGMDLMGAGYLNHGALTLGKRFTDMWEFGLHLSSDYTSTNTSSSTNTTVINNHMGGLYALAYIPTSRDDTFIEWKLGLS